MCENKLAQYNLEMAEHANGAAQALNAIIEGRNATYKQTSDLVDYLYAKTKINIESCPFVSRQVKEEEIHRRENVRNALKLIFGI